MAIFGNYDFPGASSIPDPMAAIPVAPPSKKKRGGFGGFLKAWAGYLGDNLTGSPVYANSLAAQQQSELENQRYQSHRQDDLSDYETHKKIDQQYAKPDTPGLADEFNWFNTLAPEQQQAVSGYMKMRYPQQFAQPTPVTVPYGASIQGGSDGPPQPGAIQDGYRFKGGNPADPNSWEQLGGPSPGGSGGFP